MDFLLPTTVFQCQAKSGPKPLSFQGVLVGLLFFYYYYFF